MKPEDIKIGSIWRGKYDSRCIFKVTAVEGNFVCIDRLLTNNTIANGFWHDSKRLIDGYEPVYQVEGFEV